MDTTMTLAVHHRTPSHHITSSQNSSNSTFRQRRHLHLPRAVQGTDTIDGVITTKKEEIEQQQQQQQQHLKAGKEGSFNKPCSVR
mmetsp:Transcript_50020/g.57753  ORF Transcript_50020/g.57753 Transcript_50020/m.57753 type:complete len:85 (+) Transcript_50020:1-255(+)